MTEKEKTDKEKLQDLIAAIDHWLAVYEGLEERIRRISWPISWLGRDIEPYYDLLKSIKSEIDKDDWTERQIYFASENVKNCFEDTRFFLYKKHTRELFSEGADNLINQAIEILDSLYSEFNAIREIKISANDSAEYYELSRKLKQFLDHRPLRMKEAARLIEIKEQLHLDFYVQKLSRQDQQAGPATLNKSKPLNSTIPKDDLIKKQTATLIETIIRLEAEKRETPTGTQAPVIDEPITRDDYTDTEQNILEALAGDTLTGAELLKRAGYNNTSHYRQILSNLCKRDILGNNGKGYFKK